MTRRWLTFLIALMGLGISGTSFAADQGGGPLSEAELEERTDQLIGSDTELAYVSDYFSFVGRDAQGHVAFAIDNNRGRKGEEYQAEHFVILHDENQGWVEIPGYGKYENLPGELRNIPDSPYFSFEGNSHRGLTITARDVPLSLELAPIELKVVRTVEDRGIFAMGSAAATLHWKDRTLRGRVIQEYLVVKGWNRLSGFDFGTLFRSVSFQGLYLVTEEGNDLYVHNTNGGIVQLGPAVDRLGFYAEGNEVEETRDLEFEVLRKAQGLGLFRWPVAWRANWKTPEWGPGRVEVQVADFKRVASFVLGGFGMGIVTGYVEQGGRRIPVYGWAEIVLWRA